MDDLGRNLADETGEIVSDAVVNASAELRKRRSTRIVQAVPLQVTGVDALGRPFVERTSSLILNCHGCRYQSKHYVLKNMWVRLEIPHPEADQEPRTIRGRVAWIQRPRTVRQLFQVALELEVPGNAWGIAFPPEDWFAFAETEKEQTAAAGAARGTLEANPPAPPNLPAQPQTFTPDSEFHVSLTEPAPLVGSGPDKVRVFPSPTSTTDASLQLARQVTRLLADARQQIQAAAREAAAQAVSSERHISAEQWEQKLATAHEELSRELSSAVQKIQEESDVRSRAAHHAAAAALQDDLPRKLAPQLEELTRNLAAKLSEAGLAQRTEHAQQLTNALETLRTVCQQAEETTARLQECTERSAAQVAARTEAAQVAIEEAARQREDILASQRESLAAAAHEIRQQITSALASAQSTWQNHLTEETEAAQMRWQSAVDNALSSAHERAVGVLNEHAHTLLSQFQQESERLAGTFREAAKGAASQSEQQVAELRESIKTQTDRLEAALARAGETSERLEQLSARLELAQQQALSGFQSQVDDVLSLHRNELHRRSESLFDEIAARIRRAFEESSQQGISSFGQQIDSLMLPHVSKTEEAMQRLAGSHSLVDAALALQQERIRSATDEAFAEALAQFRGNLSSVEQLLQESAETVTARSLAELEARAEGAKHQTMEDLLKSAEWYEKRAQTQIQAISEKISEQAGLQLREKAGDISNEFAGEMDQSSRNFVSYAQTQMAELVGESFEKARALFAEAAETTSAAFIDEIQRHARQDLEGFEAEIQKSTAETRIHMDVARAELTERVTTEQKDFLRRFQGALGEVVESGVADANQKVQAGFEPLLKSWKSMTDTHQAEMQAIYARSGEQAAEQYRERLDNVSNQWMLATVTSLDHQWREVVAGIAAAAEEKLRETCTKVFADLGDALRERLQQIGSKVEAAAPRIAPQDGPSTSG
jgi:hypothetical protein